MKSSFKHALVSSLLAGAGLAAFAQGMGPMGEAMGGPPHPGMARGMHQPDPAKMQARIDKRLGVLKAKLKITPEQEGAWGTFTAAMKPPVALGQRPDPAEIQKLTTPERIDKMRALRAVRQAEMDRMADAVKAFYATLTPEQKKVFDSQHLRRERQGWMHGMGGDRPAATK